MPHQYVIPTTLFFPHGGISLTSSTQTRGRLESERNQNAVQTKALGNYRTKEQLL